MIIVNRTTLEKLAHEFDGLANELLKLTDTLDAVRDSAPDYKPLPPCYTRVQLDALIRLVGFIRDSAPEELVLGRDAPGVDHELSLLIRLLEHIATPPD